MASGLDGLEDEVGTEPDALRRFALARVPRAPRGSIFVGAGDSYAAALAGFYASGANCIAFDPYALASRPAVAKGRDVFFISVSGSTSANVKAAKEVKDIAHRTTAITAVPDSPLGTTAERTLVLPMTYVPRTPGMLSFCLSLLAVLMVVDLDCAGDFEACYSHAKRSHEVAFGSGVTYFLGNSFAHPVALYASAKTYEVAGSRAQAEQLEEFSHMQLFSLARPDVVNVFSCFDPAAMAGKLTKALRKSGYRARLVPSWGSTAVEQLFHAVFIVQHSVLREARASGLKEPRFLDAGRRLRVSDSMIY